MAFIETRGARIHYAIEGVDSAPVLAFSNSLASLRTAGYVPVIIDGALNPDYRRVIAEEIPDSTVRHARAWRIRGFAGTRCDRAIGERFSGAAG